MSTQKKERDIEAYLVDRIEQLGGECLKLEVRGRRGWTDRICILPTGLVFFVEMKKKDGRTSRQQAAIHRRLRNMGHHVEVLWSYDDVNIFTETLRRMIYGVD